MSVRNPDDPTLRELKALRRDVEILKRARAYNPARNAEPVTTSGGGVLGFAEVSWTSTSIVNNAVAVEAVCDSVTDVIGSCAAVTSNRLELTQTGVYQVHIELAATFTPSANGRFSLDPRFIDPSATTYLAGAAAVPLISGVTNAVDLRWAEWLDAPAGTVVPVDVFQVSGANRSPTIRGQVIYFG